MQPVQLGSYLLAFLGGAHKINRKHGLGKMSGRLKVISSTRSAIQGHEEEKMKTEENENGVSS